MRLKIKLICLFLFISIFFSCILTSKNPLGDKKLAVIDENLLGLWMITNIEEDKTNDLVYLLILKGKNEYLQFILFENYFKYSDSYQGYITEINNERYLNIWETEYFKDSLGNDNCMFAHYKITKKKLVFSSFNEEFFEKAIEDKLIKGEILNYSVALTDTTENIITFINKQKNKNFLHEKPFFIAKKIKKISY